MIGRGGIEGIDRPASPLLDRSDYRDRFNEMSDLISPCQLSGITGRFNCQGILVGSRRKRERD